MCYPGTSNYSLVWLPIDVNSATAATLNPSILNNLIGSPQSTPQKQTPPTTITTISSITTSSNAVESSPTVSSSSVTPSSSDPTVNNPLLTSNLSAAITQSYLQLLQLQQLQQQAYGNQVKPDGDRSSSSPVDSSFLSIPSVSSLLPIGTTSSDILTQAVSGSIPATSNSGRTTTCFPFANLTSTNVGGVTSSQTSGNVV